MRTTANGVKLLLAMSAVTFAAWAIQAGPGQGIHYGPWMISPYVDESGTYDSNINQDSANARDDYFLNSEVGVRASYSAYMIEANALGYGGYRSYADTSDKDFGSGGEIVGVKYGLRERVLVQADESFRHVSDVDTHGSETAIGGISADSVLDAATRAKRDLSHFGASLGRDMTEKVEMDFGYRYDAARYDEAGLANLVGHNGQLEGAYQITDKSAAFATLFGGLQKNSAVDDAADYYGVRLGAKTHGTDKVSIKAGAGVEQYDRPSGTGDNVTRFNFDAQAVWVLTDKVLLRAGGRNGTLMSSILTDNASDYTVVWAGAVYRMLPTVALSLSGMYRIDDYIDPVTLPDGSSEDRQDKGKGLRARADYQTPASFMSLYAETSYEAVDSNVNNYDETRVSIGANLKY